MRSTKCGVGSRERFYGFDYNKKSNPIGLLFYFYSLDLVALNETNTFYFLSIFSIALPLASSSISLSR